MRELEVSTKQKTPQPFRRINAGPIPNAQFSKQGRIAGSKKMEEIAGAKPILSNESIRKQCLEVCPAPWLSLLVYPLREYAPCCFTANRGKDFSKYDSIEELWNDPYWQHFRELISEGRYKEARCPSNCHFLGNQSAGPYDPQWILCNINSDYLSHPNFIQAYDDYLNRRTLVSSHPAVLQTFVFYACNLRCIMCTQDHFAPGKLTESDYALLLAHPDKYATWVSVGGARKSWRPCPRRFKRYARPS